MISATHKSRRQQIRRECHSRKFRHPDRRRVDEAVGRSQRLGRIVAGVRPADPEPRAKRFCEIASALAVCINQNDMPNTERQQRIRDRSPRATCAKLNDAIPSDVS